MKTGMRWKHAIKLVPLICVLFIIYLILSPSASYQLGRGFYPKAKQHTDKRYHIPGTQGTTPLSLGYNTKEILDGLERNAILTRSIRSFKSRIIRELDRILQVNVVNVGIFVCCYGYFIRKKRRQLALPAILIGGHAPPEQVFV